MSGRGDSPAPELTSALERPSRVVMDLSALPTVVFGSRGLVWWGTVGFMVVEGTTLAIILASYFYLRRNFVELPPLRTPLPSLGLPTATLLVMLLALVPTRLFERAAKRLDAAGTRRWLWASTATVAVATAMRYLEFRSLNVHYDANAYASAVWAVLFTHFTLLIVDVFETGTLAAIFTARRYQPKHFVDATDNAMYTYFMALVWIPAYVVVYWVPRWI